jgi:hypothetical protein
MERETITCKQDVLYHLGATIANAIALIDPRGTDIQISQAISIVHLAFSHSNLDAPLSPNTLYERAFQLYLQGNCVQNCEEF